ncbi:probable UDP-arabinopyranose mutase 5 [Nymphaea colorata]|uniref:probable UDP-arabinopyranose mutase 5 n=1 Tax=Nymphaea colorata TaxID=210225 RepID=UPI00129E5E14|nr:probable UDP-arabinopyranose mutase 5 [Nymphaea colorata]
MFKMVEDDEVDIVIAALNQDLGFLEEWRSLISRFHIIIVKDPELDSGLQIPPDFPSLSVYTRSDMEARIGPESLSLLRFTGFSTRYYGYLLSKRRYVVSIDADCVPLKDNLGRPIDIVRQHLANLTTPATPLFFNTLYDPYAKGSDFVRGYPFGLRCGVNCAVSCGLWLNIPDFDASILKSGKRNDRLVDAVLTVPKGTMLPLSGVNVAFDRELIGPALFSGLILAGEGKVRHETVEDLWCGMCVKVVCDHLGYGIKSGMPYVQRGGDGETEQEIQMERTMEGTSLLEVAVPFFQTMRLPQSAVTAEECIVEMAKLVREELGRADPSFARAADAMEEWVRLWRSMHTKQ